MLTEIKFKVMAKSKKDNHDSVENIQETLSKTEQFIEKNQKTLTIIIIAIMVIVGGYIGYKKLYLNPMKEEAYSQMYAAEKYFEVDSFYTALNGDGNMPGFLDIIDEYGNTEAGNLAKYYAGICYLNTGDYQNAVDYLESFSTDDIMLKPVSIGATGDAYLELGDEETAIDKYLEAAETNENEFTSPFYRMKLARLYESRQEYEKALEQYTYIKKNFKNTNEGRMIEKYIIQVKMKGGIE
ncbi:MAG: hypothetical protein Kow0068_03990 [Marinilabiliales bacterium]